MAVEFPVPLTKWDAQVHRDRLVGMYDWQGLSELILVVPQAHGSDKVHGIRILFASSPEDRCVHHDWCEGNRRHILHRLEPLCVRGSIGAPNWHGYVWDGQLWEEEPPGYIAR